MTHVYQIIRDVPSSGERLIRCFYSRIGRRYLTCEVRAGAKLLEIIRFDGTRNCRAATSQQLKIPEYKSLDMPYNVPKHIILPN